MLEKGKDRYEGIFSRIRIHEKETIRKHVKHRLFLKGKNGYTENLSLYFFEFMMLKELAREDEFFKNVLRYFTSHKYISFDQYIYLYRELFSPDRFLKEIKEPNGTITQTIRYDENLLWLVLFIHQNHFKFVNKPLNPIKQKKGSFIFTPFMSHESYYLGILNLTGSEKRIAVIEACDFKYYSSNNDPLLRAYTDNKNLKYQIYPPPKQQRIIIDLHITHQNTYSDLVFATYYKRWLIKDTFYKENRFDYFVDRKTYPHEFLANWGLKYSEEYYLEPIKLENGITFNGYFNEIENKQTMLHPNLINKRIWLVGGYIEALSDLMKNKWVCPLCHKRVKQKDLYRVRLKSCFSKELRAANKIGDFNHFHEKCILKFINQIPKNDVFGFKHYLQIFL